MKRAELDLRGPNGGNDTHEANGTGFDHWIERTFEHTPLDERAKTRAAAFARAGHPSLQGILRVDREASLLWLEQPKGRPLVGTLTTAQAHALRSALDALHEAGIAHGEVDRAHVLIDDEGAPCLRFTPTCDPTATIDRDRLALARLGGAG